MTSKNSRYGCDRMIAAWIDKTRSWFFSASNRSQYTLCSHKCFVKHTLLLYNFPAKEIKEKRKTAGLIRQVPFTFLLPSYSDIKYVDNFDNKIKYGKIINNNIESEKAFEPNRRRIPIYSIPGSCSVLMFESGKV